MNYIKSNHLSLLIILWLVFGGMVSGNTLGANRESTTYTNPAIFTQGVTVSSGDLTVTTAASATSTLTVGGIEMYATSSATKVCLIPVATTSNVMSGNSLVVQAKYGSCP